MPTDFIVAIPVSYVCSICNKVVHFSLPRKRRMIKSTSMFLDATQFFCALWFFFPVKTSMNWPRVQNVLDSFQSLVSCPLLVSMIWIKPKGLFVMSVAKVISGTAVARSIRQNLRNEVLQVFHTSEWFLLKWVLLLTKLLLHVHCTTFIRPHNFPIFDEYQTQTA